jgi:tRNA A37 threonylcarbamoyladenosine modification protein TsaB
VIFAFSTSCSVASVAVFSESGELLFDDSQEAQSRSSGACLAMLAASEYDVKHGTLFLADAGPGSFTGTRVGIVLAKTFSWAMKAKCGSATAFDLVSATRTVVFPSKKGEWFVRRLGEEVIRQTDLPDEDFVGFGPGIEPTVTPLAKRFQDLLPSIVHIAPEALEPGYLIEPSISTPKKKYGSGIQ